MKTIGPQASYYGSYTLVTIVTQTNQTNKSMVWVYFSNPDVALLFLTRILFLWVILADVNNF